MGRIMSMIGKSRARETAIDSLKQGENEIEYWKQIVANPKDLDATNGDTYRATFEFSEPCMKHLENLRIPVLVSYGTKDISCPLTILCE